MCIKREKKNTCKDRWKNHTSTYKENKYNVCVKMVTRPNVQEQCVYKKKKRKDT